MLQADPIPTSFSCRCCFADHQSHILPHTLLLLPQGMLCRYLKPTAHNAAATFFADTSQPTFPFCCYCCCSIANACDSSPVCCCSIANACDSSPVWGNTTHCCCCRCGSAAVQAHTPHPISSTGAAACTCLKPPTLKGAVQACTAAATCTCCKPTLPLALLPLLCICLKPTLPLALLLLCTCRKPTLSLALLPLLCTCLTPTGRLPLALLPLLCTCLTPTLPLSLLPLLCTCRKPTLHQALSPVLLLLSCPHFFASPRCLFLNADGDA
jgi:hypothetical protein